MKKQFIVLQYFPGPGGGGLHPTDPPPVNGGRDSNPNGDSQDTEDPAETPAPSVNEEEPKEETVDHEDE
jgi:hypothetical protein